MISMIYHDLVVSSHYLSEITIINMMISPAIRWHHPRQTRLDGLSLRSASAAHVRIPEARVAPNHPVVDSIGHCIGKPVWFLGCFGDPAFLGKPPMRQAYERKKHLDQLTLERWLWIMNPGHRFFTWHRSHGCSSSRIWHPELESSE